jgi:hypothetical protein
VRDELVWPILCGTAGIAVFPILRAGVRLTRAAFADRSDRKGDSDIPAPSVEHLVQDAQKLHIDPQVARETSQLLASLLPPETSFGVNDELRGSLRLSERQIDSLMSALPGICDRSRLPISATSILSVYDLLQHIQSSPKSTSGQFDMRTGSAVQAAATSLAATLAGLQNASPATPAFVPEPTSPG